MRITLLSIGVGYSITALVASADPNPPGFPKKVEVVNGDADAVPVKIVDGSTNGNGDGAGRFQFVGLSTQTTRGDASRPGMNALCQQDFPASRICLSTEIIETVSAPSFDSLNTGWVEPVLVQIISNEQVPPGFFGFDASGVFTPIAEGFALNCNQWTSSDSDAGLFIGVGPGLSAFAFAPCQSPRSVACCAVPAD